VSAKASIASRVVQRKQSFGCKKWAEQGNLILNPSAVSKIFRADVAMEFAEAMIEEGQRERPKVQSPFLYWVLRTEASRGFANRLKIHR
jgi:hypothetical protein